MERAAAMRADHRRMIQQMMQRVVSMRTAQSDSDVVATSPDRLDALENHLRSALFWLRGNPWLVAVRDVSYTFTVSYITLPKTS